jgi:deoxyribodipyrimidine photolyase
MRAVHWFRNDLRVHDNPALAAATAYPAPIVDHAERRVLAQARYAAARVGGRGPVG